DAHNELAVVDYVEDIYRFYKSTEGKLTTSLHLHELTD
uniref:Uncharacterized protein n=1 Tax=Aegilops tauschii subsp. strangulata TaxID=200361 RepID=A0A453ERU9_AEGTS